MYLFILKQQSISVMITGAKARVADATMKEFIISFIGSKWGVLVVMFGGVKFIEKQILR